MADVFISYSRRDSDFVRRLHGALDAQSRNIWVDWEDIPLSADWWREIKGGIDASDTFVFVMSPHSMRSPICQFEVEHAIVTGKRIVPVVLQEVNATRARSDLLDRDLSAIDREILGDRDLSVIAQQNWKTLSRFNWLFFTDEATFDRGVNDLMVTMDSDLAHTKMHTQLVTRIAQWQAAGQDKSFLLDGAELAEAETWLSSAGNKSPEPTDIQRQYIFASRTRQTRRQRQLLAGVTVSLFVAIGLSILSFLLFGQSQANLETAEENLFQQRTVSSLFLSDLSQQQLHDVGNPLTALSLAIEANRYYEEGVVNDSSKHAIVDALNNAPIIQASISLDDKPDFYNISRLVASPDGQFFAVLPFTHPDTSADRLSALATDIYNVEGQLLASYPGWHQLTWMQDSQRFILGKELSFDLAIYDLDGTEIDTGERFTEQSIEWFMQSTVARYNGNRQYRVDCNANTQDVIITDTETSDEWTLEIDGLRCPVDWAYSLMTESYSQADGTTSLQLWSFWENEWVTIAIYVIPESINGVDYHFNSITLDVRMLINGTSNIYTASLPSSGVPLSNVPVTNLRPILEGQRNAQWYADGSKIMTADNSVRLWDDSGQTNATAYERTIWLRPIDIALLADDRLAVADDTGLYIVSLDTPTYTPDDDIADLMVAAQERQFFDLTETQQREFFIAAP